MRLGRLGAESFQGGRLLEHRPGDVELGRKADGGLGLVAEPVAETAPVPVAEVHLGQGIGEGTIVLKLGDDVAIGQAFMEHEVNPVADGLGEAGDFAVARVTVPAEAGIDRFPEIAKVGGRTRWRSGVMEWWIHGVACWLMVESW